MLARVHGDQAIYNSPAQQRYIERNIKNRNTKLRSAFAGLRGYALGDGALIVNGGHVTSAIIDHYSNGGQMGQQAGVGIHELAHVFHKLFEELSPEFKEYMSSEIATQLVKMIENGEIKVSQEIKDTLREHISRS